MRRFKPALACTTLTFLLLSFVATPATASEPDEVSEEEITSSQGPSPYVEADTEEEAMRKLDAIEKEHPQGISAQAVQAVRTHLAPCRIPHPKISRIQIRWSETGHGVHEEGDRNQDGLPTESEERSHVGQGWDRNPTNR